MFLRSRFLSSRIHRIPAGLLHAINGFGAGVPEFRFQGVGPLSQALGYGAGPSIEILLQIVTKFADPLVFEGGLGQRPRHRGTDRKPYRAKDQRLSFQKIRMR